uniref:DNA damage-induced apoptosis suppressor protein n=1 Tax=Jaculus jaculus TaxID=51337 RepID=A0A8C5K4Q3_JACJA
MNRRQKFLLGSVLALQNSSFIYPSCQKCFSRLILDSKRSTCPKCGCTGEAGNASYRYKLSLKVAESNKLHVITVFGNCLDKFFGLTAIGLHRFLQDSDKIPETLDSDTTQHLLTKAVKNCFVGQSFIFGVTNSGNLCGHGSDYSNFCQQCCENRREVGALVASQIVLPDPHVAGFTVIDYFHQFLQTSNFKKHCDSQETSSYLHALDHSSSDPSSSICGSENASHLLWSCDKNSSLRVWQPSLELTSVDSELTDTDLSAAQHSVVHGTPHQNRQYSSFADVTSSRNCQDLLQDSWSFISYMDKKNAARKLGKELVLQANHLSAVSIGRHESGVSKSNLPTLEIQELLEEGKMESSSIAGIKNMDSSYELPCYQHHDVRTTTVLQERSACWSPSTLRLGEMAGASQNCDSLMWDDLPFSESLNKFLTAVESEIALSQTDAKNRKHSVDNDMDQLHADQRRLCVTPQRSTGSHNIPAICFQSSQAMAKENSSKDNLFSNCESNPSPGIQKESQDNTEETIYRSNNGRDISEYFLPNIYLSAVFTSSKNMKTSVTIKSTTKILPHRSGISLRPSISESDYCLSSKYLNGCEEKSLSEMNIEWTTLCSNKYNDSFFCKSENKQIYGWPKGQGSSFAICRKLTYPLESFCSTPRRSTNTLKKISYGCTNNFTQSYSGHEGSYDASADLFDDIAKDKDNITEITETSQDVVLPWDVSKAKPHPAGKNYRQPSQKLSLQSVSASRYPRPYSPLPHNQLDSECDLEDSQDFIPCSQSTPVSNSHQRIFRLSGAFQKLPSFYSDLDTNYKKTKFCPGNDKQATPTCPKNVNTPSQKCRNPVISSVTQLGVFNHCTTAECLETEGDEWVPPTPQKVFISDMPEFKFMGLRKCLVAHHSPDQKELPRKKMIQVRQKTDI